MTMSACSDWVNVSPNTDVESEDLFTSESGFKSALIGIYGRMTDQSLYGGHMTFNFMENSCNVMIIIMIQMMYGPRYMTIKTRAIRKHIGFYLECHVSGYS